MHAKDLMTTAPVHVTPETSIGNAISLMLDRGISGLPVLDDAGVVCGILTEGDLLKRSALNLPTHALPETRDEAFFQTYLETHGPAVGDCMSRNVISVGPETPLFDLVTLMRSHNVKRLPVLDDGRLIGIVSRCDVIRAISMARDVTAAGDESLRLAVATRLRSELGLGPDHVDVQVHDGLAEITAKPGSRAQQRAVQVVAESVAGVAGVVISARA
jgi:CBS domain-containing protein